MASCYGNALMWGRFRRWPRIKPILLTVAIIGIGSWVYMRPVSDERVRLAAFSEPAKMLRAGPGEVLAVIDGDTLLVRQPAEGSRAEFVGKVRLLGINTPETVKRDTAPQPWGKEATEFLQQRTAAGEIRLELDKRRIDRYGRFLAYVYVGNQHLNEELVAAGLARVHTYPGDSMTVNRKLLTAQDVAKRERRGIWSQSP